MTIADRIQRLRKLKGVSQEELADRIGVSRQAVSKWESEQSVPDLDKIIAMSEYFDVTTDYLLKGIEAPDQGKEKSNAACILAIVATALNFLGLVFSAAIWHEQQTAMALVAGLVFMTLGCMVFGVGMISAPSAGKSKVKRGFWTVNIWLLPFLPLSFIYNVLTNVPAAPYPLPSAPLAAYPFWLAYIALGVTVELALIRKSRAE